jgi:hypothetical protein
VDEGLRFRDFFVFAVVVAGLSEGVGAIWEVSWERREAAVWE